MLYIETAATPSPSKADTRPVSIAADCTVLWVLGSLSQVVYVVYRDCAATPSPSKADTRPVSVVADSVQCCGYWGHCHRLCMLYKETLPPLLPPERQTPDL